MPIGTIAAIVAVIILVIAVPLGIMLFLRKRGGAWTTFLIGAGTFILFAFILENLFHALVLLILFPNAETVIRGNIWLYGLYGGLAAGLFEETGRFLAFRFALRGRQDRITSLAYGIGHGGIEAFLIAGLTMVNNLILGLTYANAETLPPEMAAIVETLLTTPASMFLWSGFERLYAMAAHMALSVLVFACVRTNRRWLYPAAILTHTAVNFTAVVFNAYLPIAATELLVAALTALAVLWAARIYKNLPQQYQEHKSELG
ncbi:MAG: YhfC family intramembrane metalloprotease [Oscillospiraceae bacterium]|nr:YhfC family intramembrane metalloprotease [Oscillospiraceae bacterium]